jgi:predicted metal-dependent phosphotriesterase family hydrolase
MKQVNTVLGPIHPEQLGMTSLHEHLLWGSPGWQWSPEANEIFHAPTVLQAIHDDLADYRAVGGRTLVDLSGIGICREPEIQVLLSRWSGVQVVACTGFWQENKILPYFAERPVEYMTDLFVHELTVGMGTTTIKAGIIKVGCGHPGMTALEERTFRAAARASKQTGALITTHGAAQVRRQLEVFGEEGVDPGRVIIGHRDDATSIDLALDREVIAQGYSVGYDHIGMEGPYFYASTDERRLEIILEMLHAGHINQMILACDTDGASLGQVQRTTYAHKYAHLIKNFLPRMRSAGVSEDEIETLLVKTPARLLPF